MTLLPVDEVATAVDLGPESPAQVARSSVQVDAAGTRQATVLVPAGTSAALVLADGTTNLIDSLTLRATEYTVGDGGPAAMPAELPLTSGYTYCVELSADEALAANAATVQFDRPLWFYVDNFVGMPVGIAVPTAYYDRQQGAWVPTADGRVIRVLSITNGVAVLDVTGSGQPSSPTALNNLGIAESERAQLASIYSAGTSLWRVGISHFTPYDLNYGVVPVAGAEPPNIPPPVGDGAVDSHQANAVDGFGTLEIENQVFHETIPLAGTPFALHHASDRVPGRRGGTLIQIPLSGSNLPAPLKRILLQIQIAGQCFTNTFAPLTNLVSEFTWDGRDAYGRMVVGKRLATVRVGYVYDGFYALPPSLAASFGAVSGERVPGDIPARTDPVLWQQQRIEIGRWGPDPGELGGWTLSIHHAYDPGTQTLYLGPGAVNSTNWAGRCGGNLRIWRRRPSFITATGCYWPAARETDPAHGCAC